MTRHRIIFADSRDVVLPDESVALVITSPPYFVGREYESYIKSTEEYWNLIYDVFQRLDNAVEPFGKVAVNFGDKYSNSADVGRVCEILYSGKYYEIFDRLGYDLWARIIWDKVHVFLNEAKHLVHNTNRTGQMRVAPNWEYIFVWRKRSQGTPPVKKVDMTDKQRVEWTDGVWSIPSVRINERVDGFKLAKFPEEIPTRLIQMYTEPGDTILDPFGGTCTTAKAAINTGRNSIMIEKNPAMRSYIENYLVTTQLDLFNNSLEIVYETL